MTTLIYKVMGVTGEAPHTSKLGTFLLMPLKLHIQIYSNFQKNGASVEFLKKITTTTFIVVKMAKHTLKVSPEAPFFKLL